MDSTERSVAASRGLFEVDPEVCTHPREMWRFLYTYSDWFDGDEDDIYECGCCGKRLTVYVPR